MQYLLNYVRGTKSNKKSDDDCEERIISVNEIFNKNSNILEN